jgi:hypothetical protein
MPSNSQLIATGLAVVATGFVGYAAWFDYKRRNDAVFRKNLSECLWWIRESSEEMREFKDFG